MDKNNKWKKMTEGDRLDSIIKTIPDIDSDDAIYLSEKKSYKFVRTCLGEDVI